MGSVYRRGNKWNIKYYRNGKAYREAVHSKKKSDAEHRLKMREGQIEMGTFAGLQMEKTTWEPIPSQPLQRLACEEYYNGSHQSLYGTKEGRGGEQCEHKSRTIGNEEGLHARLPTNPTKDSPGALHPEAGRKQRENGIFRT
jgi:hypothetical protein